jgi:PAS domain S-box-containing protein
MRLYGTGTLFDSFLSDPDHHCPTVTSLGVPPMVLKLTSEIAQRKRAQQLQQESETILFSTINTALDAVVQIDSAGIITDWNGQVETTFGWYRAEAIGWEMIETIIPPQYREKHTKDLKYVLAGGDTMVLNKRIEITALFNYVRKVGVKPIRQETEKAKSQFISTVSHELRTPLTSIKAALGLIQSRLLNHSPEQLQLTVEIACRNTAGLHKLID